VKYLYSGDTVVAERANGGEWVYYGFGSAMYQQVSSAGAEYQHWNLRGDLVATSSPTGGYSPAPLTDAFGDTVAGAWQTYDWNGAWGYRKEAWMERAYVWNYNCESQAFGCCDGGVR
jgi:hypothetical protein